MNSIQYLNKQWMHQQSEGNNNNNSYPQNEGEEKELKKISQLLNNQQKIEYPPFNYTIGEVYMIRKESFINSNDLIFKKLSKCFKKIRITKMAGRQKQIYREYDPEVNSIRRSFKKVHDLFKLGSKATEITNKKIDKIKNKIQKVQKEVSKDEMCTVRDLDMSKIFMRPMHTQPPSSQKNLQK